jgi:signal transduction histidine kinase
MSHDIKSPLNSLKGILQVYNMGGITPEEFKNFSQQIESNLSTTSILVDNILFWTAGQLKGVNVVKSDFDLRVLIDENIALFQSVCSHKKIKIKKNLHKTLLIHYDRNILNFVLRNLLSNALKFSHEGGEVNIHVVEESDQFIIDVADQGVGMSETVRNSIFNPQTSVSTKGTTNEQGTGIGLSLCREYLERADGMLMVRSELGVGTTFTVYLPKF